jgi:N-acetyl-anhydromuramyl-L-alanine amidase AmpD
MPKNRTAFLILISLVLASCGGLRYVEVMSTNENSRVNYLVIHATSGYFGESLRLLTTRNPNPVSSHYLVPYRGDPTYNANSLSVYRLVPEERRAWHAGVSQWGEETSLNDRSIGIEVVNNFTCNGSLRKLSPEQPIDLDCNFPSYPESQMEILIVLIEEILGRHPEIDPVDIVAHADIAPNRKSDPGPQFPWEELYNRGIGAWYDVDATHKYLGQLETQPATISELQCALLNYGYPVEVTGEHDTQSKLAFRAFQLHFRPSRYNGLVDNETAAILYALNEKYDRGLSNTNCKI